MSRPPSRYRAFHVVLDGREEHGLEVRRAPPFVRFTLAGDDWKTLDVLDQLDDKPKGGERVIAARKVGANPVHFKFSGKEKSKSGWYLWVQYESVPEQPPEQVLRETELWRDWCRAHHKPIPSS